MYRSHDIDQRQKKEDRKLPNLLGGRNLTHLGKEEEGKLKAASSAYEKAKPSEEGRAGYTKANPSRRRGDYCKIHPSDSKEATAEVLATRYPDALERELIWSCAGQWVKTTTTDAPILESKLRDAPRDLQHVPADTFEISEFGVLFDVSLSQYILCDYDKGWYLGDLKVWNSMLSQTDMDGKEHFAKVVRWLKDDDGNTFPQMLQWSNGEVWTRKRPELEKLHGHWHTYLRNCECIPMSVPRQTQTNHGPNGELEIIVSRDGDSIEKLWVLMEPDPEHPGSKRLRWSNGQLWYPGETPGWMKLCEAVEKQCELVTKKVEKHMELVEIEGWMKHQSQLLSREGAPVIVSPSDSSMSQNTRQAVSSISLQSLHVQPESLHVDSLLAHIQNRDREIQGLLSSSVEVAEEEADFKSFYVQSAENLLAHIQNREREIQGLLSSSSSVEVAEDVEYSMVPAAIVEDHFDEFDAIQSNKKPLLKPPAINKKREFVNGWGDEFDEEGNLKGEISL